MKTYKVELTEEFIKEAHASACSEWKTKIENLVPDAFAPQTGKWYKYEDEVFFITDFDKEGHACGYGIAYKRWIDAREVNSDSCILNKHFVNDLIPATTEEVEEMLTKESMKKGLFQGVEVKSVSLNSIDKIHRNSYFLHDNSFFVNNGIFENICIMKDGVWAKPIENENLKKIEALENEIKKLKSEL